MKKNKSSINTNKFNKITMNKTALLKNTTMVLSIMLFVGLLLSAVLVFSTTHGFVSPIENSSVKAGANDVIIYQFSLTTGSDSLINGTAPAAGTALDATDAWNIVKFYDDGDTTWETGSDWIGKDDDSDGKYTAQSDTLVDSDGDTTIAKGSVDASVGAALTQYNITNGDGNALCVNNVNTPTAVRIDSDDDCSNGGQNEGTYLFDSGAVSSKTVDIDILLTINTTGQSGLGYSIVTTVQDVAVGADNESDNSYIDVSLAGKVISVDVYNDVNAGGDADMHTKSRDDVVAAINLDAEVGAVVTATGGNILTAGVVSANIDDITYTVASLEADEDYYYVDDGDSKFELGEDLFLNAGDTYSAAADTKLAGTNPAHNTALTATDDWNNVKFYDGGLIGTWNPADDFIVVSIDSYYLDKLNTFFISNTGTAVDTTDIDTLKIYDNNACSGTNETLIWDSGKWIVLGLDWALDAGINTYTVCANVVAIPTNDVTIIAKVATDDITLESGSLPGSNDTATGIITVDTVAPLVSSITLNDTTIVSGETSLLTIVFSEPVFAFSNADFAVIDGGNLSAVSSSNNITWTAVFTPTTNLEDNTNIINLTLTSLTDGAGNFGVGNNVSSNYIIDTLAPTVVISDNQAGLVTDSNNTVLYTFEFSEDVTNFTTADISVIAGGTKSTFSEISANNYTILVTATDDSITAISIIIDKAAFSDMNSNLMIANATNTAQAVDTRNPSITILTDDTNLNKGDNATINFTLSESSINFIFGDVVVNGGILSDWNPISGTLYTAIFTPTDDSTTLGTINVAANTFTDSAGNNNTAAIQVNMTIDTIAPFVSSMILNDTTIISGETALLTIVFSEPVFAFSNTDFESIEAGNLSAVSSANNITWTATFTPTTNLEDNTNIINLTLTSLTDSAGNTGTGNNISSNYIIDTLAPTVNMSYSSNPADVGLVIITATYSEAIANTPRISINQQGTTDISNTNMTGAGTTWTYNYTVVVGNDVTYKDGNATVSLSSVTDLLGNTAGAPTSAIFVINTLNTSKNTAYTTLNSTLAGYNVSNYNSTNWIVLNGFKTDGDSAIGAALNLSDVISAQNTATSGMDGVETIAETLAAAKITALTILNSTLANYTASYYFDFNWNALIGFKSEGDSNITAAADLSAVINAKNIAVGRMASIPTIATIFDDISVTLSNSGIVSNLADVNSTNIGTFQGLYFENRINVTNASTVISKITFNSALNLSNNDTQEFLQALADKMDAEDVGGVGLNLSGATDSVALKNVSATIKFYGLDNFGFDENTTADEINSKLIAFDDDGNIIDTSDLILANGTYLGGCENNSGCYVFTLNVTHFTKYEIDNIAPEITVAKPESNSNGYTFSSSTTEVTLLVTTNENATCKYSESNISYNLMSSFGSTGGLNHTTNITISASSSDIKSYTYYVICSDSADNVMNSSSSIQFYVAQLNRRNGRSSISNSLNNDKDTGVTTESSTSMYDILVPGSRTIDVTTSGIPLNQIILTTITQANNVKFVISVPSTTTSTYSGKVYKYLQIDHIALDDVAIGNAKIKFKVEKSWLTSNGLSKEEIVLVRYTKQWDKLVTTIINEDSNYVYYQADSPGLSLFAITTSSTTPVVSTNTPAVTTPTNEVKENIVTTTTDTTPKETTEVEDTTKITDTSTTKQDPSTTKKTYNTSRIIVWLVILMVLMVMLYFSVRKPKN